jgi:hypothetical protein
LIYPPFFPGLHVPGPERRGKGGGINQTVLWTERHWKVFFWDLFIFKIFIFSVWEVFFFVGTGKRGGAVVRVMLGVLLSKKKKA